MANYNLLRAFAEIRNYLKDIFNLREDRDSVLKIIENIKKNVSFKGTNAWILFFAIIVASIGLNVNSTAVIIGAMLISPLMGPIMGAGLALGISDFSLLKKSLTSLLIASAISVLTSAIYFYISPLHEAQSELLARTYPTIFDVLIAFFGGFAGIVAGSSSQKGNAIPGVAIATALMPPLCTVGYGLATWQARFFWGASFLFIINCVFIGVSTYIFVRYLNFPRMKFESSEVETRTNRWISFISLLIIVPSIYFAYLLVFEINFTQNTNAFLKENFNFKETYIISKEINYRNYKESEITVMLYGKPLNDSIVQALEEKKNAYGLQKAKLVIQQPPEEELLNKEQIYADIDGRIKSEYLAKIYDTQIGTLADKDAKIKLLEDEIFALTAVEQERAQISQELHLLFPAVTSFSVQQMAIYHLDKDSIANCDTITGVLMHAQKLPKKEEEAIRKWLKLRLGVDSVGVFLF
ncbi:MAG: TIGR00341 family protein [Chitinophagales bacterium]|nr:TIGR00341 family protein [Bacteroidota bacterium]MCB9042519.1 TIGR00341 family protein [Chitinophagales bacterium]